MKTTNLNELAASKIAANARKDLKKINPFYYVNELNKLARKNEFCENVNIKVLQDRCKKLHNGRYGFDVSLFEKDYLNRFCTCKKVAFTEVPFMQEDANYGDILAINGKEIRFSTDGFYAVIYVPITISLAGFITAFQKVVSEKENAEKAAKAAEEKAAKAAERAAKAAAKENAAAAKAKEKQISALVSKFVQGEITKEELNAQILAIDLAA